MGKKERSCNPAMDQKKKDKKKEKQKQKQERGRNKDLRTIDDPEKLKAEMTKLSALEGEGKISAKDQRYLNEVRIHHRHVLAKVRMISLLVKI